ncbi:MAG TPA: hypothetical protein VD865_02225 [Stenotrophomonas sp.]|nr:hypothetical protein [Stenotrophomonas sp.]
MSAPRIAVLDAGTYYHRTCIHAEALRACWDRVIYARELDDAQLDGCDALVVSCRTNPALLIPQRERLARFLASGRTVVAMGETDAHLWLDGVRWTPCEVNYWWWTQAGADSGLRLAAPAHALFGHIGLADATWHQHGSFQPPPGAVSLIDKVGAGSVLYEHDRGGAGRVVVTSLDPMYHHGSHFMPATGRFLRGFLQWLRASTKAF